MGEPKAPDTKTRDDMEIKKEYLRDFIDYRNNYIEEIPPERVSQQDPRLEFYKCRAHFFLRILTRVLKLKNRGIVTKPEAVIRIVAYKDFCEKLDREKWQPDKPVIRDDIDEANSFLDFMIEVLQR